VKVLEKDLSTRKKNSVPKTKKARHSGGLFMAERQSVILMLQGDVNKQFTPNI
jgi:hypothetical protein